MRKHHYDITIIGAGLIGLCMSSMLSTLNKKVLVIDKNSVNSKNYLLNDISTTPKPIFLSLDTDLELFEKIKFKK